MQQRVGVSRRKLSGLAWAVVLVAGLLAAMWLPGQTGHASLIPEPKLEASNGNPGLSELAAHASGAGTAYLPLVSRQFPPPPPIFGTEMKRISTQNANLASDGGVHWVRFQTFDWDEIEPNRTTPPSYDWTSVKEVGLKNAADNGMQVIATIKFTPTWAQKVPGAFCGPIKQDALDEYAQFLTALVKRYSAPPYYVRYWELGNEPDVDPKLVDPRNDFGCWGNENDPYYGGGYYAQMLKAAYPAIKNADPSAQVLIGGLLLDCDPTHPPQGRDCKPARFFEGILRNGGANFFDIVSFHGYPLYDGTLKWDEAFPSWEHRGGVVLGKINFLKQVMASYGVDKPLMHTEGALLCNENTPICNPPQPEFFQDQADYVVWLFVRNWAEGLRGSVWYQFEGPGWRYSGLLDANQQPKPAYEALKFLAQELGNATYVKRVSRYPVLRGYEFSAPGKRVWVLWAPDDQLHTITLPPDLHKVFDKYGKDITPAGSTITVMSPIYLELAP
jgi:hypothetical protein